MKKSIRSIKKKFKAEQMRHRMAVATECLPVFLPIAKYHSEIISTLGLKTDTVCPSAGGIYIDNELYFKEMFDKLEKAFGQHFHIHDGRSKRAWLSQIELSDDDGMRTKDMYGMRW